MIPSKGNASENSIIENEPPSREALLAKSWTTVASAYEKAFVPRFAPWTHNALDALSSLWSDESSSSKCRNEEVQQKALVLCCGPGQELVPIAKILGPNVNILGVDLAPGMVEVAQRRIEENMISPQQISVQVGDAKTPPPGPYRVLFSAFGLQQLSQPLDAVREWIQVLEPEGGIGVILYWPPDPPKIDESSNIFDLWGDLVQAKLRNNGNNEIAAASSNDDDDVAPWDQMIAQVVKESGADILQDEYVAHSIEFDNAKDLFDRMSRAGPWHALRLRRGDDFVDELGAELQAAYPNNKHLTLQTYARMLVIFRREENDEKDLSKL
eukprot:CAMPEP_0194223478 /NCGR_PEP_ID=MMETSP0156-20130528/35253_1 /TAXON_ID=33649 /ORGANISM="Thalassionema nitzschioides, Strain L26-B" /LENGTH=325 /DNA_ID=CAMNT_0038954651 /DNA_START=191 /DNA_END=1168 /DNA_ORIENTATION=+